MPPTSQRGGNLNPWATKRKVLPNSQRHNGANPPGSSRSGKDQRRQPEIRVGPKNKLLTPYSTHFGNTAYRHSTQYTFPNPPYSTSFQMPFRRVPWALATNKKRPMAFVWTLPHNQFNASPLILSNVVLNPKIINRLDFLPCSPELPNNPPPIPQSPDLSLWEAQADVKLEGLKSKKSELSLSTSIYPPSSATNALSRGQIP